MSAQVNEELPSEDPSRAAFAGVRRGDGDAVR